MIVKEQQRHRGPGWTAEFYSFKSLQGYSGCVCVHGRHKRKLFIAISRTKIMYAQYNVSFPTLDLRLSCYGSSTHKWSGRRKHFFQDFLFWTFLFSSLNAKNLFVTRAWNSSFTPSHAKISTPTQIWQFMSGEI